MDHQPFMKFKVAFLAIALVAMSACSSSKVEQGDALPAETSEQAQLDGMAPTDAVPPAPDVEDPNLAAQAPMPPADAPPEPMMDVAETTPAPAVEDAPPLDALASQPAVDAAAPADSASGPSSHYRVKRGDTLMKIAFEQYGDLYRWKEIYEANRSHIADPNHVPPGTKLTLNGAGMVSIEKNGESYLIKQGETLGVISKNVYGTDKKWKKLWENNRQLIKDPNKIYAGFYLYYQPEGRLTHDDQATPAPASEGPGASVIQGVTNPVAVAPAVPNVVNVEQRAPASK